MLSDDEAESLIQFRAPIQLESLATMAGVLLEMETA